MTLESLKKNLKVLFVICFLGTIIFTMFDATYNLKEKIIFSLIYLITVPISFFCEKTRVIIQNFICTVKVRNFNMYVMT
ncbi:hypothetical protein ABE42_35525 [Bacillus thuringiensis]|nr:hypothetical protein [Bacillus thuringiensis]